tara:strand:- start:2902 stop:3279 length:378 start_codon:yes stop_codon:yes gene_type:complete
MEKSFILKKFKLVRDGKMSLGVINEDQLPHKVVRVFFVKSGLNDVRGRHGHKKCWQSLVCLDGKIKVNLVDKVGKMTDINLDSEDDVLVIPPGNWACQTGLKRKNLLLVLASEPYNKNDYFYDHL